MERAESRTAVQTISGLSLLLALLTFLSMWSGVTLLLTDPSGPHLPTSLSGPRALLTSILLFWLPAVTGAAACLSGLAGLSGGGHSPEMQRRALVAIVLGLTPACMAAAWLGWVLSITPAH